jgi:hypothetical protein
MIEKQKHESPTAFTLRLIRAEIIEECARVAENHTTNLDGSEAAFVYRTARKIAKNIRALSDTSQDRGTQ